MTETEQQKLTTDAAGNFRPDFIFSYWIFAWFLLFMIMPRRQRPPNPKLALIVGLAENIILFGFILAAAPPPSTDVIFKFAAMMLCIKIAPLWFLGAAAPVRPRDVAILAAVFVIYLGWLILNGVNLWEIYEKTYTSIVSNKNQTPFFWVFTRAREIASSFLMTSVERGSGGQQ